MQIPVLPHLNSRHDWLAFCRRERPYCYVRNPQALVDLQTGFLILTQLSDEIRDGRRATKYSIGSRHSVEPAWRFIEACRFDLAYMLTGLAEVNFDGNVRDNSLLRDVSDVSVRKFFSKDASVIAPSTLGSLEPLLQLPEQWLILDGCRLLANQQFKDLRTEQLSIGLANPAADLSRVLLDQLVLNPQGWQLIQKSERLVFLHHDTPLYSLLPYLPCPGYRRDPIR